MSTEVCLKFPDLATMLSEFVSAGLQDGCDNVTWVIDSTAHAFFLIDDAGSGCRWDAQSNQIDGAWCCGYLIDRTLPTSLEQYLSEDVGNCCGMATRNG